MGWMSKPAVGEGHITILGSSYDSLGSGNWFANADANQYLGGYFMNGDGADGDNVSFRVYLDAGTYTLRLLTLTNYVNGILDIDMNGTEVASFDLYSIELISNVLMTQTGIVIATPGLYTLNCREDGKNEDSEGCQAMIGYIALWRTA